jgi:hypothetical protein
MYYALLKNALYIKCFLPLSSIYIKNKCIISIVHLTLNVKAPSLLALKYLLLASILLMLLTL